MGQSPSKSLGKSPWKVLFERGNHPRWEINGDSPFSADGQKLFGTVHFEWTRALGTVPKSVGSVSEGLGKRPKEFALRQQAAP